MDETDVAQLPARAQDDSNGDATGTPPPEELDLAMWDTRRRLASNVLTPQEALAVYFHLNSVLSDEFAKFGASGAMHSKPSEAVFKKIIQEAPVYTVERLTKDTPDLDVDQGGRYLYVRGRPADYFCLVLDGEVDICAGEDNFESKSTRWNVLCPNVLRVDERELLQRPWSPKPFVPDFTGKIG